MSDDPVSIEEMNSLKKKCEIDARQSLELLVRGFSVNKVQPGDLIKCVKALTEDFDIDDLDKPVTLTLPTRQAGLLSLAVYVSVRMVESVILDSHLSEEDGPGRGVSPN